MFYVIEKDSEGRKLLAWDIGFKQASSARNKAFSMAGERQFSGSELMLGVWDDINRKWLNFMDLIA